MDRAEDFANLAQLEALRRDREAGKLDVLRRRLLAVEGEVAELEKASVERPVAMPDIPSPYQMSGRDQLWDAWRLSRLRDLALRAAGLRADIEAQTLVVRHAFGRHQVMERLGEDLANGGRDRI